MPSRIYFYQESLARTTTTSTTYGAKVSLSFTPNAGKTYAIFWSALTDGSSTASTVNTRLYNITTSTVLAEIKQNPGVTDTVTHKMTAGGFALYTAGSPATQQQIAIQFAVGSASVTGGIEQARCLVIELIDNVDHWSSDVAQSTTTTDYTTKVINSWTASTAGDYLTVASGIGDVSTHGTKARLLIDGTLAASEIAHMAAFSPADAQCYVGAYRHIGISGSHSAALQWGNTVVSDPTPFRYAYIVSLRLDRFGSAFWAEDRTQHSTTSATYTTAASATGVPSASKYAVLACGNASIGDNADNATSISTRISVDGTAQGSVVAHHKTIADWTYRTWWQALVREETAASTTWTTQYARSAGTKACYTDEHVLAVLQLESVGQASGVITYIGTGAVAHGNYNVATNPELPSGTQPGDLLICLSHLRSAGTLSSSWETHRSSSGSSTYLLASYKIATGSDTSPVITPSGTIAGQHHTSAVVAFRGANQSAPFGSSGPAAQYASAEDIGPVTAGTASGNAGAVLVFAGRNDAIGSPTINVSPLTGDGLSWVEIIDASSTDNKSHLVADYAIWSGSAPSLTAKTFDVPTGSASAPSAGCMLIINQAIIGHAYVGTGTVVNGDHTTALNPPLPSGVSVGDLLLAIAYLRGNGTLSISSGWTQHSLSDVPVTFGLQYYLQVWYRFAQGGDVAPTITITGGTASPQSITSAECVAFSGVSQSNPFGTPGADSINNTAAGIGPIAEPTGLPDFGSVIVFGARNSAHWTSMPALTGDGLTWQEIVDNDASISTTRLSTVIDYATWNSGAPTLTAKTFSPTGGAGGPGFGKMFVLRSAVSTTQRSTNADTDVVVSTTATLSASLDCSVEVSLPVGVGALAVADHDDVMVPGLPSGIALGDLLLAVGYLRNAGVLSLSDSAWQQHSLLDTSVGGNGVYLQTWYCIYDGTQTAPSIAVLNGSTSPQSLAMSFVVYASGVNATQPFAVDSADALFSAQTTIGPIQPPTGLPSSGSVFVLGIKHDTWTSVPQLSGDGLSWTELVDNYTHTLAGLSISAVIDRASWSGSPPPLTAKTFSPVGASSTVGLGKMFVTNSAPIVTSTVSVGADSVIITGTTRIIQADAYVAPGQRFIQADFDGVVSPKIGSTISFVSFMDGIAVKLVEEVADLTAVGELSAQTTATAWLVLLTLDHPELPTPIRVTSDGVPTVSGGNIFSPFPFEIILPDDVEGRPPQAQLRIDNTTQEIVSYLRNLTSPPKLTVQIVRSLNPDIVEYQWFGLEWSTSSYNKSDITGTLTFADLSREEFPYVTFDSRFRGLFP